MSLFRRSQRSVHVRKALIHGLTFRWYKQMVQRSTCILITALNPLVSLA